MGVKSEKDPLTGISPVRLLFERSLHLMENYVLFANSLMAEKLVTFLSLSLPPLIEMKVYETHRTCNDRMLVKVTGIVPDKVLLLRRLFHGTESVKS